MRKHIAALLSLLLLAGCEAPSPTPVPTPPPTASPEPLSPVYTDWSKLTPYEPSPPVYTLHPGYRAGGPLEAREDYGTLLPYIGAYSTMERYVIDALPLFGLVTDRGELVCGPVYTAVSFFDDFLLLSRADSGRYSCTLAAADGSWTHELTGGYVHSRNGLLLTSGADGSLTLWNEDGEVEAHFESALFTPWLGEGLSWGGEGGPYVDWTDGKVGYVTSYFANGEYREQPILLYLDFSSGAVLDSPPPGYSAEIDYSSISHDLPAPPEIEGCNYLDRIFDSATGQVYFSGYYRGGQYEDDPVFALFDREGHLLAAGYDLDLVRFEQQPIVRAGLYATVEDDSFCFRSLEENALVFRYPMRTNSD